MPSRASAPQAIRVHIEFANGSAAVVLPAFSIDIQVGGNVQIRFVELRTPADADHFITYPLSAIRALHISPTI